MKTSPLAILVVLVTITSGFAQTIVSYTEAISYHIKESTSRIQCVELLPYDIPGKQKVLSETFSVEPDTVWFEDGSRYAKFHIENPRKRDSLKLVMHYDLLLYRNDLHTNKLRRHRLDSTHSSPEPLTDYLKREENFQVNNKRIQAVAKSINGETEEEIVRKIHEFVVENIEYKSFPNQDRGALRALKTGKGDCTEYSELMITLCRAKNIPSRIVYGVVVGSYKNPRHNWVEVYLSDYGWVAFDPTFTNGDNLPTTFEKMENRYIYLGYERFLDSGNHYWGDWTNGSPVRAEYKIIVQDHVKSMFREATKFYQKHEYDSALQLLDKLAGLDIHYSRIYEFQGMIYARQNNFTEGLNAMQKALAFSYTDREKMNAYYAFGNFFALQGENELALSYISESLKMGFSNLEHLQQDEDLKNLYPLSEFQKLIRDYQNQQLATQESK
ncbi:MAG: transglutaminase domain-containing protein [Bacteroidota bacterium]